MKHKIAFYFVPADKVGLTLLFLDANGWRFDEGVNGSSEIMKYYVQATSRDYDGHKCVFKVQEWKNYKLVSITSDLLMKANNQKNEVGSYADFKKRVGL